MVAQRCQEHPAFGVAAGAAIVETHLAKRGTPALPLALPIFRDASLTASGDGSLCEARASPASGLTLYSEG